MSFFDQLQPASYRGIPFFTKGGRLRFGRRNAVHQYPFRDTIWVEDLGRAARRITISGFLVGDDVIDQRRRFIDASETPGDGSLVHPTLGRRQVALIDIDCTETQENGRVFELTMTFVEQGARQYPDAQAGSGAATNAAATAADTSASTACTSALPATLTSPASVDAVSSVASGLGNVAAQASQDATALVRMTAVLPSSAGGLQRQGTGIQSGQVLPATADLTVQDLIGTAAKGRQDVAIASDAVSTAAAGVTTANVGALASAIWSLVSLVAQSASTPGDAIRALEQIANYSIPGGLVGDALAAATLVATLIRRTAVIAVARYASIYRPETSDDAAALRGQILDLLNREIDAAAAVPDDDAYASLRQLRAAVTQQLNATGASLPALMTVSIPETLPALALAQRLYRDASRSDELSRRAGAINPAFMPNEFQALSS